jgi:sugar phosphate isomerase/epimerase
VNIIVKLAAKRGMVEPQSIAPATGRRYTTRMHRRQFLAAATALGAVPSLARARAQAPAAARARFRTGLVAYTYREALQAKTMSYEDLVRVAVDTGTDGLDLTVYWLPSTADDYLFSLRRLAYRNRVEIYSIGTRVQLANPPGPLRDKQFAELRHWVDVASKLGASHIRVFGAQRPKDASVEQALDYAGESLRVFAEYSGAQGITLGVEDDGGLTEYARETLEIVKRANSPWAGMNLDIGNFRAPKVHEQIETSIPYAVSTHIKTTYAPDDGGPRVPFDLDRIFAMFAAHGYKGYMGLEMEAVSDVAAAAPATLRTLRQLAAKYSS